MNAPLTKNINIFVGGGEGCGGARDIFPYFSSFLIFPKFSVYIIIKRLVLRVFNIRDIK